MSKGDRNRVKDHKSYGENWDRIFGQGDKKPTEDNGDSQSSDDQEGDSK